MRRFGLSIFIAIMAVFGVMAQSGIVQGGDDAALRAYIAYFVGAGYPGNDPQVTVAGVPSDFPFALDIALENATIVATVKRPNASITTFEVNMTTTSSVDTIAETMTSFFSQEGWVELSSMISRGSGFNPYQNANGMYCFNGGEIGVNYDASTRGDVMSVNLYVNSPADPWQCTQPGEQPNYLDPTMLIPAFTAVENATIRTDTGGPSVYGRNMGSSSAFLTITGSMNDVFGAYSAQLADAGWTPVNQEIGTIQAISQWTVQDAEGATWQGTFSFFQSGATDQYAAIILIEKPE